MSYGSTHNFGAPYAIRELDGLTEGDIQATGDNPVRFCLAREAGRVVFDGSFQSGRGSGRFTFVPDPGYLDSVRALGVEARGRRRPAFLGSTPVR